MNIRQMTDAYSLGLTVVAGAQVRVGPGFWLGAAAELPGFPIAGGGSFVLARDSSVVDSATNQQIAERSVVRGDFPSS